MRALLFTAQFYFLLCIYFLSMPMLCMEQLPDWPMLVFTYNQEPTTLNKGPISFTISKGGFRSIYPACPAEELSQILHIHKKLFEKDLANNKEDSGPFIVNHSRYMQFVEQRDQIINTCVECLCGSITAQLQLLSLSFNIFDEQELSEDINKIFQPYVQAIIEEFYDAEGEIKLLSTSDYTRAARRVGNMLGELLPMNTYFSKLERYKQARIPGFEKYYNDVHSKFSVIKGLIHLFFDYIKPKNKYNFAEFKNVIINNPFNKDLCTLKQAYSIANYAEAYKIRENYSTPKTYKKEKGAQVALDRSTLIENYLSQLFQASGPVERLRALQERYKDSSIVQPMSVIAEKYVTRNEMRLAKVDTVKYLVSALYRVPESHLKKKDNPARDKEFADAYDTFFDERGLPIIFDYNEEVLRSLVIPLSLSDYGRVKERLMLFKLASLCTKPDFINNEAFKESLKKGLQYLCCGIRDAQHAQTYHLLIEALYNSLTDPENTLLRKTVTHCDFLPSKRYAQMMHSTVLDHVRTLLHVLGEKLSADQELFLHDALTALSRVWAQARDGSKKAEEILSNSKPTAALIQEGFLKVPYNYEKAHNAANYFQQRMDELGFNKIITSNAFAMSAPALKKIEIQCAVHANNEAVPNFTTIMAIMHDAYTPKPITKLLKNALDIWYETENSQEVREIAVTATLCAEAAYDHHKKDDQYYFKLYVKIGKGLCKYALIFGQVVVDKVASTFQTVAAISKFAADLSVKSAPRFLEPMINEVRRFSNAISGKGYHIPEDYFDEIDPGWREKVPSPQEQHWQSIQEHLESMGKAGLTAFVFLARIGGADAWECPDVQAALNAETCQIIEKYVDGIVALPAEKKFESAVGLACDFILPNLTFKIASHLFKILDTSTKTLSDMHKIAFGLERFEDLQAELVPAYEAGALLIEATDKSLIPKILSRAQGAATKGGSWLRLPNFPEIYGAFLLKVADLELKYGKEKVEEARKIARLDDQRIIERIEEAIFNGSKIKGPNELLEEMLEHIKKIDSDPRWSDFRRDPSNKHICELKNIYEALAGIACEEQGLLNNLIRDPIGGSEFIDPIKKYWDVKAPKSYSIYGHEVFDKKEFFTSLKNALKNDITENFIIDLTYLENLDHQKLFFDELKKFPKNDIERCILIDIKNPANSKTTSELLKFLNYH